MGELVILSVQEGVRLDGRRIAALLRERGMQETEVLLRSRLRAVAAHVAAIEAAYAQGHAAALSAHAAAIAEYAADIGLAGIARIARDAETCANRGDCVGFRATCARMQRLSRRSLDVLSGSQGARA